MSSSTNSFLRGQRKTDLLELAEAVGFKKYVGPSCPISGHTTLKSMASPFCGDLVLLEVQRHAVAHVVGLL